MTFKEANRRIELEIRDLLVSRPDLSYAVIGQLFDVCGVTIYLIAKKFGIRRKRGPKVKSPNSVPRSS